MFEYKKKYQVYSINEVPPPPGVPNARPTTAWAKAGVAYVNRDGSMNIYLDVLPIEGRLHVREAEPKREGLPPRPVVEQQVESTSSSLELGDTALALGGH